MISIENIKDYLFEYRYYKKQKFKFKEDTFNLYMELIKTMVLIPICLLLDVILFPFEIGYLIFKKVVKR